MHEPHCEPPRGVKRTSALRLARPNEDNVVTRRLASVPLALFASTAYLERRGAPGDPDVSLEGHDVLLFADSRLFTVENRWWFAGRTKGAKSSRFARTV